MYELTYPSATTLGVYRFGFLHYGIATSLLDDWGEQLVVSGSLATGRFVKQTFSEFAGGRRVFIASEIIGPLHPLEVERRALERVGKQYRLLSYNCEHFVRDVHGLAPASPQLTAALLSLGLVAGALFLVRAKKA